MDQEETDDYMLVYDYDDEETGLEASEGVVSGVEEEKNLEKVWGVIWIFSFRS